MSGASLPSWVRVGAKCVCVRQGPATLASGETIPAFGEICTIREVVVEDDRVYLLLQEHKNPRIVTTQGFRERPMGVWHFRPIVDDEAQERDVAEFRKLLTQPIPEAV